MKEHLDLTLDPRISNALLEAYVKLSVLRDPETGEVAGYQVMDMNKQAAHISGLRQEDALGRSICDILAMDADCWQRLRDRVEGQAGSRTFDYRFERIDRRFLISPVHLSEDEILLFFAETTYRTRAEEALRIHEILFENAQDIILYVDMNGQVVNANQKACDEYGYTKEQLLGLHIQEIRHPSTSHEFAGQMNLAEVGGIVFESIHLRADGSEFSVEVSARSTETENGMLRIHIIRDITERKEQEAKIAWLAHYDSLTEILNRASFIAELEREVQRAKREKSQFAVLVFDIDKFKHYNDSFGHQAGDHVLKHVAQGVKSVLRVTDQIGRLGGDEFALLQTNVEKREDILCLASRIERVLATPITYQGQSLKVTISLGIAVFSEDALEAYELLNLADQAMYQAKRRGGNGFSFVALTHLAGKE